MENHNSSNEIELKSSNFQKLKENLKSLFSWLARDQNDICFNEIFGNF